MADKMMYIVHTHSPMIIHKITPSVDFILWLKRLDTQLDKSIHQKSPKLLSQQKRKQKNWGLV